jgi:hypothetical protein
MTLLISFVDKTHLFLFKAIFYDIDTINRKKNRNKRHTKTHFHVQTLTTNGFTNKNI